MAKTSFTERVEQFAKSAQRVSMNTHPTLLVDMAFKLGIEKPGADKEKLVEKVNRIIDKYQGNIPAPTPKRKRKGA